MKVVIRPGSGLFKTAKRSAPLSRYRCSAATDKGDRTT